MVILRSYATLAELFNDLFNKNWEFPIFSFGFFVGMAFLVAGWVLYRELKRKEKQGIFKPIKEKIMVGEPASSGELIFNAVVGFLIGFKLGGMIAEWSTFNDNPQHFIFSSEGNIIGGILGAAGLAYLKFREKKKQRLPKPEERTIDVYPHHRLGDIVMIAAIFGILGAKIFSNFEEPNGWRDFIKDPLGNFFNGLTIYGGLLLGALAVIIYARKKKINVLHLGDAVAPALILAYAVGRIGCQVAGDGDWGVLNSAYISQADATITLAQPGEYEKTLQLNANYYEFEFDSLNTVPAINFKAPPFIPRSWVAQNYAHNVNGEGSYVKGCQGDWCGQLPVPVFPTPLYEIIMSVIIFGILWFLRKRIRIPGMLLALYVVFAGIERFIIEKIRVNNVLSFMGIEATQATFISVIFIIFGLGMMFILWRISKRTQQV
ncbi:MAG: prolipoprotein diacylglyceryl transferase [Chitinophagales bacterium]